MLRGWEKLGQRCAWASLIARRGVPLAGHAGNGSFLDTRRLRVSRDTDYNSQHAARPVPRGGLWRRPDLPGLPSFVPAQVPRGEPSAGGMEGLGVRDWDMAAGRGPSSMLTILAPLPTSGSPGDFPEHQKPLDFFLSLWRNLPRGNPAVAVCIGCDCVTVTQIWRMRLSSQVHLLGLSRVCSELRAPLSDGQVLATS